VGAAIFAALCSVCLTAAAQQNVGGGTGTVFATGNFTLPEGISAAPSSFGGGYLVSDVAAATIDQIGPNGGEATVFSTPGFNGYAGTQLSSYYNGTSIAGQYLEVGSSGYTGMGDLISSNGTATNLFTAGNSSFSGVVTASSNFGSIQSGQEVLVNQLEGANAAGQIDVLNKNGTLSAFASSQRHQCSARAHRCRAHSALGLRQADSASMQETCSQVTTRAAVSMSSMHKGSPAYLPRSAWRPARRPPRRLQSSARRCA